MASQSSTSKARINRYRRYLVREEKLYLPAVELESDISGVQGGNGNLCAWSGPERIRCMGASECSEERKETTVFPCKRRIHDVPCGQNLHKTVFHSGRVQISVLFQILSAHPHVSYGSERRYGIHMQRQHRGQPDKDHEPCRTGQKRTGKSSGGYRRKRTGGDSVSYACLEKIKDKLWHSEVFLEAMVRHSKEAVPALTGYLTQEGLLDGTEDALVDSGWSGPCRRH